MTSRRLRFEVLRRDGYTCQYCGARAPDVILEVDHVVPETLGGDDDPRNLVTACKDCNAGKASVPPDAALVAEVDATALLFAKAVEHVAAMRRADTAAMNLVLAEFDNYWTQWKDYRGEPIDRDHDWRRSVEVFIERGLVLEDLKHFVQVAMRSKADHSGTWKYFCGCCHRELTTRHELARRAIEDGDV